MVSFSALFLFTTVVIREALDLLHWHFKGATMTLFHHILTCSLHLQQPALQTEQQCGDRLSLLLMATWRTLIMIRHLIQQPIGPSAGYSMWTTIYDLDLCSREAGRALGPPEVTPEHSFHLGEWVIWQPFLLWHLKGNRMAHCHKIYQQATISLLWLTAPPSFLCGYKGPWVSSG